jgi:ADP-ribose pyrophosphatase YjhB (NUDIX family)
MVREGKPDVAGRWNLPGGHVEAGEGVTSAAIREVREETGLSVRLTGIVGVFVSRGAVRFVFEGQAEGGTEQPGDDIEAVAWLPLSDARKLADGELDAPGALRPILEHIARGPNHSLDVLVEHLG